MLPALWLPRNLGRVLGSDECVRHDVEHSSIPQGQEHLLVGAHFPVRIALVFVEVEASVPRQ